MPSDPASPSRLLSLARMIRHAPGLARLERLWRGLRPLYHRLLERVHGQNGIPVSLGRAGMMHVPASFIHNQVDPHEERMLEKLMSEIRSDTCFYDIGASIGLHSLAVGEKLGKGGEIHSFEPDPPSGCQYGDNTRLLRRRGIPMSLHCCFVADKTRAFTLESSKVDLSGELSSKDGHHTHHLYLFDAASAAEHPAVSLDDYIATGARPPTVLKCDIEGAELLMLRGAAETLRRHQPRLFLSVHPTLLPKFGHNEQAVYAALTDAGYRWEIIDDDGETHVFAQSILPSPRP